MLSSGDEISEAVDISALSGDMYDIKELLYYSACRPVEFAEWVNSGITVEGNWILIQFSHKLRWIFFSGDMMGEAEIEITQREIFTLRRKLSRHTEGLTKCLHRPDFFEEGQQVLKDELLLLNQGLQHLFAQRDEALIEDKPLHPVKIDFLIENKNEIFSIIKRVLMAIAGHDNVGHQLKRLTNEISELFEALSVKQRVVERAVRDRQTLNNYQAAMAQLLFEGKTEKLGIVLSRYPDLARFLQKNIHKLVPIHAAFKEYLNSKPSLLQEPIPIDEMLAMADFKYAAIAKQRERVEAEIKDRDARLMEKRIYIFDAYRLGFELYEKGEYREALLRLMAGAESLHYSSLLKSGEMIANGEGCRAHPELACLYLQAAVVFAGSKEQKTTTIKVLTNVYRVVICGEQKEMEAANDGIDKRAGDFRVVFNDLKKHIFQLGDNPALRLYNLGESYLVLYKTVLDEDKHIKEMANSNLANACQYFESAYRYADSQRKRYCIMYINIIEEDPDKDEGEYAQGITLALEKKYAEQGANKVEDILQQRIELKEKYIDAVKIQVKVMDKMSEEIKSIYERIGISEDGLLIIELAKKIKLSLPAYVECPTVSNRGL